MSTTKPTSNSGKKHSAKKKLLSAKRQLGFADLGGLSPQIQLLRELIEIPLKEGELLKGLGLKLPRGILLYGSSGTGKTSLARALANESKMNVAVISTLEALSAPVVNGGGDMESHLVRTFNEAKEKSPCIVLIDDLETLCPKYETGHMSLQESKAVGTLVNVIDALDEVESA